jgi:hypothetical protein
MKTCVAVGGAVLMSLLLGCAKNLPEPNIASSAAEPTYAASYPSKLQQIAKALDEDEANARTLESRFAGYSGDLTNPPWDVVLSVVQRANDAGHSQAYVEQRRAFGASRAFFDQDGPDLIKKVAGSAQYVVKDKGCSVDVTGPIAHAFKDGVDKQLEKRLRGANEAHRIVDEYRDTLGKKNAAALEKQADELAEASYLVDIDIVEQKVSLRRMLAEVDQVKKTIPEAQAAERAFQSGAGRTEAEKQASHQRIEALNRAQSELEAAINSARKLDEGVEKRLEAVKKAHTEAYQKLLSGVQGKVPGKK